MDDISAALMRDIPLYFGYGFGLATFLYWIGYAARQVYHFMKG